MVRRALVLLVLGGCTPLAEPLAEEAPPSAPVSEADNGAARALRDDMDSCTQTYPPQWDAPSTAWIWDSTDADDDPAASCRLGCSLGPMRSSWSFDGVTVSLLDHGDLVV